MQKMRIALAQMNPTVGDLDGNAAKIIAFARKAEDLKADMVVFPELALSGYPPEDLVLKKEFLRENGRKIAEIKGHIGGCAAVVGFVDYEEDNAYNGLAVIQHKRLVARYHKNELPNYGVFDEKRYFTPGTQPLIICADGIPILVNICEDIWAPDRTVAPHASSVKMVLNISASPYHTGKFADRAKLLGEVARRFGLYILYVNIAGGQDELVFDGASLAISPAGEILAQGREFEEDLFCVDIDTAGIEDGKKPSGTVDLARGKDEKPPLEQRSVTKLERLEEIYRALVLGTRDYVRKNGFEKVVFGISGGIDSSLCAAIAADALGAENVVAVTMPSEYTSDETARDAERVANNLGVRRIHLPISPAYTSILETLRGEFEGHEVDETEENIQARIRAIFVMSLANKFGWLAITTGNKSETSCGYCTLYGDMAGGFAIIKDVPKTLVWELARFKNREDGKETIPESVITRIPTAELKADQKDEDTLPPYPLLDQILKRFIEEDKGLEQIVAEGFPRETVKKVINMVDKAEFKRRQGAPGIKITPKAFGKDRRMPITNKYRSP
jgi:NAD+ synthase (glutamine-hydrolysing)